MLREIFATGPTILVARVVVLAMAVLILIACVYAIASIVIRMSRREWLRRAGGFEPELSQPADQLDSIFDFARSLNERTDEQAQEGTIHDL